MATIKGVWLFGDYVGSQYIETTENYPCNFTSNGQQFKGIFIDNDDLITNNDATYFIPEGVTSTSGYIQVYNADTDTWADDAYRTIDFGTTDQTVGDGVIYLMNKYATPQVEEPTGVTITYNDNVIATLEGGRTATMHCAGKKMVTNITITAPEIAEAKLQEKTICENCEATPDEGYDGFSKVVVDVPIPDGYIVPTGTKEITENCTEDVTEFATIEVNVPIPEDEIYDGSVIIHTGEPLMTPSISLNNDILTIASSDYNTDSYAVLVDGVEKGTIENNIEEVTLTIYNCDGSDIVTTLSGASPAEVLVIENEVNVIWADKSVSEYAFEDGAKFLGLSLTATTSDVNNAAIGNNSVFLLTEDTNYYAFLEPIAPTINIEGDILTITAGDQATETFVIQPGSIIVNRTGDNTTVDLSTIDIAFGNQTICVYAKIDCIMSDNSNTVAYYKEPPADSKSLTVNITGYSYGAYYWVDKEPFDVASDSYVSSGGSVIGIMNYVFLQSSWASYSIPPSAISNCSVEFYDDNGNIVTSGYGAYAKVYNIGDNASIKLYDND